MGFDDVIKKVKKSNFKPNGLLKDANWLRQARNEVAAHPLYIGNYIEPRKNGIFELKETDEIIWANKIMFRDIKKLLRFLEPSKKKEIEEKKISKKDSQGKILEEFSVKNFLKQQKFEISNFVLWYAIQNELIEEIAFNAYRRMVEIINAVFQTKDT